MRRAVAGLAAALVASACSYDFRNPAEQLGTGQALGRVVVDRGAGAQPLDSALVSLANGGGLDQVTRSTGRFTLLSLPIGRHRVLFRKGTQFAGERYVDIAAGEDGKPEGVNLGDVRLRASLTLQGTLTLPPGFSTADYRRLVFDVTDEVTGQPAALSSSFGSVPTYAYSLRGLSVGEHRLRFVVSGDYDPAGLGSTAVRRSFGAAPLTITIPDTSEGQQLTMASVGLDAQSVGSTAPGSFRFRLQAIGAGGPAAAASSRVELLDAVTFDPAFPGSATIVDTAFPDSAGWVQADELPGLYVIRVVPPASGANVSWVAPELLRILVRASALTELGSLYLVDAFTASDAASTCFADAECSGGRCVAGACQGGGPVAPPAAAPLTMPYCIAGESACFSTPGGPCGVDGKGVCLVDCTGVAPGTFVGIGTCYPDATTRQCTPDGVNVSTGTLSQTCP
jgi:hypothetical protein